MEHIELLTTKHLANYLNVREEFILKVINEEYYVNEPNLTKSEKSESKIGIDYQIEINKFYLKKKSKTISFREVYSPNTYGLTNVLKILNNKLSNIYIPKSCVHGFVKGRSTKSNAKQHLAKKHVLSIDIKNFFESINLEMIQNSLIKLGFFPEVSEWIAKLTTINGYLVQGFHSSPTIANIVAQEMDDEFIRICGSNITYTRYADDLYFSSNIELPQVSIFEAVISKFLFQVNEDKTSLMQRGRRQYVTGLTVFDSKTPRIPKRIKRNIRLEVYYICKYGYEKHAVKRLHTLGFSATKKEFSSALNQEIIEIQHRLFGWLHYIQSIEPIFANKEIIKLKRANRFVEYKRKY
ncbi:MAG: reverse transcriptase family protein [Fluviicola sp.]